MIPFDKSCGSSIIGSGLQKARLFTIHNGRKNHVLWFVYKK